MTKTVLKKFAKRLIYLRKESEMTQDDLARKSGISRSSIAMIETAKRDITLYKIHKLAVALEVDLQELINF